MEQEFGEGQLLRSSEAADPDVSDSEPGTGRTDLGDGIAVIDLTREETEASPGELLDLRGYG